MPSATRYCHFNPKGTVNAKGLPTKSRRCKRTEDEKENSPVDCEVDSLTGHCGLRDNTGRLSRSRLRGRHYHTSRVHKVGKVSVPSKCANVYHQSGKCEPECKLVKAYNNRKTGKLVKASCRNPRSKSQK